MLTKAVSSPQITGSTHWRELAWISSLLECDLIKDRWQFAVVFCYGAGQEEPRSVIRGMRTEEEVNPLPLSQCNLKLYAIRHLSARKTWRCDICGNLATVWDGLEVASLIRAKICNAKGG